jgi:hypothetical protein
MSIFPTTDIVADVARAADPQRLHAAMRRLADASPGASPGAADFATYLTDSAQRTTAAAKPANPSPVDRNARQPAGLGQIAQQFEAFLLQSFLETLLPKDDHAFGGGTAGNIWRSMTAEQIGGQLARHGVIGLDKVLARRFGLINPDATQHALREIFPTGA